MALTLRALSPQSQFDCGHYSLGTHTIIVCCCWCRHLPNPHRTKLLYVLRLQPCKFS
jgi:hypothetical protein